MLADRHQTRGIVLRYLNREGEGEDEDGTLLDNIIIINSDRSQSLRTIPSIAGPPTQVAINMAPAIINK